MDTSSNFDGQRALAARLHELHAEAGDVRRRLSFVTSRFRNSAEVEPEVVAALRTRTTMLLHHTLAFVRELQKR